VQEGDAKVTGSSYLIACPLVLARCTVSCATVEMAAWLRVARLRILFDVIDRMFAVGTLTHLLLDSYLRDCPEVSVNGTDQVAYPPGSAQGTLQTCGVTNVKVTVPSHTKPGSQVIGEAKAMKQAIIALSLMSW
jgi:hypothetical protein